MKMPLLLAAMGVALTWAGYKAAGVLFLLALCAVALIASYNQAPATVRAKAEADSSEDDPESRS